MYRKFSWGIYFRTFWTYFFPMLIFETVMDVVIELQTILCHFWGQGQNEVHDMDILLHPPPVPIGAIQHAIFRGPEAGPLGPLVCCKEFERKFREQNVPRAPQQDGDLNLGSKPPWGLLESRVVVIASSSSPTILYQSSQVSRLPLKLLLTNENTKKYILLYGNRGILFNIIGIV